MRGWLPRTPSQDGFLALSHQAGLRCTAMAAHCGGGAMMRNRSLVREFALLATITLAPLYASAQGRGATPARTPDGKPDLAGIYSFSTVTPLQRPDALEGKATLTDQEAAAFE